MKVPGFFFHKLKLVEYLLLVLIYEFVVFHFGSLFIATFYCDAEKQINDEIHRMNYNYEAFIFKESEVKDTGSRHNLKNLEEVWIWDRRCVLV
jgi:hypothetical protein